MLLPKTLLYAALPLFGALHLSADDAVSKSSPPRPRVTLEADAAGGLCDPGDTVRFTARVKNRAGEPVAVSLRASAVAGPPFRLGRRGVPSALGWR